MLQYTFLPENAIPSSEWLLFPFIGKHFIRLKTECRYCETWFMWLGSKWMIVLCCAYIALSKMADNWATFLAVSDECLMMMIKMMMKLKAYSLNTETEWMLECLRQAVPSPEATFSEACLPANFWYIIIITFLLLYISCNHFSRLYRHDDLVWKIRQYSLPMNQCTRSQFF